MEVNIKKYGTPKVYWVKVIGIGLLKTGEEDSCLTHKIGNGGKTATNLKSRGQSHFDRRWT